MVVFHFTIDDCKLGMYFLKMALSCRNRSELSDCNIMYCKCIQLEH